MGALRRVTGRYGALRESVTGALRERYGSRLRNSLVLCRVSETYFHSWVCNELRTAVCCTSRLQGVPFTLRTVTLLVQELTNMMIENQPEMRNMDPDTPHVFSKQLQDVPEAGVQNLSQIIEITKSEAPWRPKKSSGSCSD